MTRTYVPVFIAVGLGCLATGCANKPPSDQSLVTDIQSKLYADATTKPAGITVTAKDGVVTLSGDVPSSDVELEAMKVANGTAGVRSVTDQMKVNTAAANPAPAPPPLAQESTPPPAQEPVAAAPVNPPPKPRPVTIPVGTRVSVRTIDAIDSSSSSPGQVFGASLDSPLVVGDRVVIPAGANCGVALVASKEAGRIKGQSELEVRLASMDYHGRPVQVDSTAVTEAGKSRGKQTAVRTGIGAAAGGIIGGLAGGGKGAAIGAAAGGGAGFGINAFTHGPKVKIPSETVLNFQLQSPLVLERR
ncbi:MAG: BON domain-containing protein [Acidobacteriaceae bacterium]|nr:BON domain-containing protein [Acidobacteriaceae bacterium]